MNNFGLIISGNLTGFTTFYETPNVNGILNGVKFNFDFRDLTTILRNEDKAYTISFAPSIIAVSLVTCLLDSFRRPGVLVVSVLLPRNKKVESAMNAHNSKALYQLLNSIHDTFREKNFVNGMLNQNKAVLMQDYYSDILSSYVLASDALQRPINTRIDVAAPNKRLGYVKSTEDNVPLYLSSLCRKSYEGYHHVFIAENAPQNIDEEPVEVVLYSVKITNNGQRIQNVRLTDKIYNLQPEEGEIDIDKNYTYQQVANGDAGRNIIASFVGEAIEITYRFGQEKRNIQFSFVDGDDVVPFASISPRVTLSNGEKFNIGSENWTFEGKEIYDRKTIESGNSNYIIKRESANLDIRRFKEGSTCLIQVERCSPIKITFHAPYNKPKRIEFRRKNGESKVFNVESYLNEVLPGRLEEYTYVIESNYYDRVTGQLPPLGEQFTIDLRAKTDNHSIPATRTSSTNHGADIIPQKTGTFVRGVNNGGTLKLEGDNNANNKQDNHRKKKNTRVVLAGVVSAFLLAIVVTCVFFGEDIQQFFKGTSENPDIVSYNDSIDRDLIITFVDADGDFVKSDDKISIDVFTRIVNTYVSQQEYVEKIDSTKTGVFNWTYHVRGTASDIKELSFVCSVGTSIINKETKVNAEKLLPDSTSLDDGLQIKLKVRTSEIKLYEELPNIISNGGIVSQNKYDELNRRINNIGLEDFAFPLKEMFKSIKAEVPKKDDKQAGRKEDKKNVKNPTQDKSQTHSQNPNEISDEVRAQFRRKVRIGKTLKVKQAPGPQQHIETYNTFMKDKFKKLSVDDQNAFIESLCKEKEYGGIPSLINRYSKKIKQ